MFSPFKNCSHSLQMFPLNRKVLTLTNFHWILSKVITHMFNKVEVDTNYFSKDK